MPYDKSADRYRGYPGNRNNYGDRAQTYDPAQSPSLDFEIPEVAKAIICATAGDLYIVPTTHADSDPIVFTGVTAGFIPPYRVRIIKKETTCLVYTVEDGE